VSDDPQAQAWPLTVEERIVGRLPWLAVDGDDWHVAFSTRKGGLSIGDVAGLNMSFSVGDDPVIVRHNRGLFCAVLDIDPSTLVVPGQVHGTRLALVGAADRGRGAGSKRTVIADTDGLVTSTPGVPIMVSFADCVPVLIAARNATGERLLALIHAGWRGMLAGIVGNAAKLLAAAGSIEAAVIGPSIGPCCFGVDDEIAADFAVRFGAGVVERREGQAFVDLWACAASELAAGGLPDGRLTNPQLCTSCDRRFYSHRRDGGRSGRQAAIAWISDT
jgi:polyphenol oxidase